MSLFGRKKEETKACAENCKPNLSENDASARILVLGSGCAKCNELELSTRQALAELAIDTPIAHVTDFAQIAAYGVMTTPALVVDGKVLSFGKVLKKDDVISLLQKSQFKI